MRLPRAIWKDANLGFALVIFAPMLALGLGYEAFLPVALISVLGGAVCLVGMSTQLAIGRLAAGLVQDLASVDKHTRDLVLAELSEAERNWFLAELPRVEAELRDGKKRSRVGWRNSALWAWRLLLS